MTGSVRWREIMLQVERESIQKVIEVGPGKVLAGLFKRTCPDLILGHVGTLEEAIADAALPLS
jgi:[acyl-carrier-protein] S-malonyltransferase